MNTFYQVCLTTKGTMAFAKATKALFVYIVCANFVIIVVKKNQSQSHALRGLFGLVFDEICHAKPHAIINLSSQVAPPNILNLITSLPGMR